MSYQAHALIGNTDARGTWIGETDGTLPTYPGPIPVAEVERQLFNWTALSVPTGNFIPVGVEQLGDPGVILMADGTPALAVITEGAQGIVRSDDYTELGRHGKGYRIHDYKEWLIRSVSNVLQDELHILSALTLRNGAQAAVEIGLAESMHDNTTGADFWPFLLAITSLDGSIATTYETFNRMLICDNMFPGIHEVAKRANRQYKVKHTVNSMSADVISGVRDALHILERSADGMTDYLNRLARVKVNEGQWVDIMDIIAPPAPVDASPAAQTRAGNRRDLLDETYHHDPMVEQWSGTALGVVQAFNTYQHHYAPVRGAARIERVYDRAISGSLSEAGERVHVALDQVLVMS